MPGTQFARVVGNDSSAPAKIGGMTPDALTLSGKYVACPANICRPDTRLAYCTGIRRIPRSMYTTAAMMKTMKTISPTAAPAESVSALTASTSVCPAGGMRATIPAKMMSEMPLPMPLSVMRSPSHMMKAVPAVSVTTVMNVNHSVLTESGTTTCSMPVW